MKVKTVFQCEFSIQGGECDFTASVFANFKNYAEMRHRTEKRISLSQPSYAESDSAKRIPVEESTF